MHIITQLVLYTEIPQDSSVKLDIRKIPLQLSRKRKKKDINVKRFVVLRCAYFLQNPSFKESSLPELITAVMGYAVLEASPDEEPGFSSGGGGFTLWTYTTQGEKLYLKIDRMKLCIQDSQTSTEPSGKGFKQWRTCSWATTPAALVRAKIARDFEVLSGRGSLSAPESFHSEASCERNINRHLIVHRMKS